MKNPFDLFRPARREQAEKDVSVEEALDIADRDSNIRIRMDGRPVYRDTGEPVAKERS